MKHIIRISAAVVLYIGTIFLLRLGSHQPNPVGPDGQPTPETGPIVWEGARSIDPQARLHWKQTEERMQRLAVLEENYAKRERALKEMGVSRRQLQLGAVGAWSAIIQTNMSQFHDLYQKAKESPKGEVVCTVCDSYSYMPCIMCKNHDGKCITCSGTGHRSQAEFCPSCLGTGRCYLCSGRGKMFCPFCDDGMVKIKFPLPHYFPPGG
jgi:hypothetical protein